MVYGVHTLGMITCSATSFAVPVMLFYLAMIFQYKRKNLKIRNFIPVLLFIAGVLTCLLSPGVMARKELVGDIGIYSMINAGVMTSIGDLSRLHTLLAECPLSFALLLLVFLFGIWNKGNEKKTFGAVCMTFVVPFLATMRALYLVMLGYGVCSMPNRICFVFDYLFFMTLILTAFSVGQILAWNYDFAWDKSNWIIVLASYTFIIYTSLIAGRWYPDSCWAKSLFSLSAVREEHDEWIGILCDPEIGDDKEYWVNAASSHFLRRTLSG